MEERRLTATPPRRLRTSPRALEAARARMMEERSRLTATVSPQPRTSPRAAEAAAATALRAWGDVPHDILVRISAFLRCRADRVHMACANRQWNAAVRGRVTESSGHPHPQPPPLPPLPPQLPWLIFPSTVAPTFYSPIGERYHSLGGLPLDIRRARCCGSGDGGWLVLALDSPHAHALYNLNSGQRIPLPLGFVTPTGTESPLEFDMRAATLSAATAAAPHTVMVAAIVRVGADSTAAFWGEGCESWFSPGGLLTEPEGMQDLVCYRGRFFFLTSREEVIVFTLSLGDDDDPNGNGTTRTLLTNYSYYNIQQRQGYNDDDDDVDLIRGNGTMRRYIVGSRRGDGLLMVVRYFLDHNEGTRPATDIIRVFQIGYPPRINGYWPRPVWEDLRGQLDGRMLFLGPGCSRSFEAVQYDGFEGSVVYLLDEGLVSVPSADGRRCYVLTDMGRWPMILMTKVPWPPEHPPRSDNAPPTWWLN